MQNILTTFFKLIRIKQWLKNVFIFAPLIFSHHLLNMGDFAKTIMIFFAFSLVSVLVYIINVENSSLVRTEVWKTLWIMLITQAEKLGIVRFLCVIHTERQNSTKFSVLVAVKYYVKQITPQIVV